MTEGDDIELLPPNRCNQTSEEDINPPSNSLRSGSGSEQTPVPRNTFFVL